MARPSIPFQPEDRLYHLDFAVDDHDDLQKMLNALYDYQDDIPTKVLHRNRLNLFFLLMQELIARGVVTRFGAALDIGCNAGMYSKMLYDFGFAFVSGIDIDSRQLQKAKKQFELPGNIEFTKQNAEELSADQAYDFVLCTEVIEEVERPSLVIENIYGALAPGGIAVFSVPNRISLPFLTIRCAYRLRRRAMPRSLSEHLRFPFYHTFRLLREPGFMIVKTSATNLLLDSISLRLAYRTPVFRVINRINFGLSRRWPLKYFGQFFYVVLRKPNPDGMGTKARVGL